jgi:aspartate/methionine/tyrosine aminotransferase
MKVKIHTLFEYLLETTEAEPEAIVGYSLSQSPKLGEFMDDLDPELLLDWNSIDFRGLPALRGHILREAGLDGLCEPSDVFVTAGTAEANYLAMMQLLEPEDEVVIETPGWPQTGVISKAIGCTQRYVERKEADDWIFPMDQLEKVINKNTKMIFVTNPNNPTGQRFSTVELQQLVDYARSVDAWLVVDEVYAGLEWEGGPRAPSVAGMYDKGITTGSVSKALGLQGLRCGWLICKDKDLIMDAIILRENSSELMNVMGEAIAEIAMRPERYAASMVKARADGLANLEVLDTFVKGHPRLSWVRPKAGLIGLAKLSDGINSADFARKLLAAPYKTFLMPGIAYDQPNHIRIGCGGGAEVKLDVGLARLGDLLSKW